MIALLAAIVTVVAVNSGRLSGVRETIDSGANASVLPVLSVASLVGVGAVVAAVPAFAIVREWVLSIEGGPLVSLAVAINLLSALTGSASGRTDDRTRRARRDVYAPGQGTRVIIEVDRRPTEADIGTP